MGVVPLGYPAPELMASFDQLALLRSEWLELDRAADQTGPSLAG